MTLNKRTILLFKAIKEEYGNKELLRRINRILNTHISIEEEVTINFVNNNIIINLNNPVTITFDDECYIVKTAYPTYSSIIYYDSEGYVFRRATTYNVNDGLIVLDHMDTDEFSNMRIIKTTSDDEEFINGSYEKERLELFNHDASEIFEYTNNTSNDEDLTKDIEENGNYCYYHLYSLADENRFLEVSSSLNTPKAKFTGRRKNKTELLDDTQSINLPNILFRGNTVDENNNITSYYDVNIYKIPSRGILRIKINFVNKVEGKNTEKNYMLTNLPKGPITSIETRILKQFMERINYPFTSHLAQELDIIGNKADILVGKTNPTFDDIDLMLMMYPKYHELAFYIYENIDKINEIITTKLHKENPSITLKK